MCVHPKALPRHRPARVPDRRLPTLDELGGEAWGSRSRLDNEPIRVELSLSTDRLHGDRVQERLGEPTLKLRSSFLPDLDQLLKGRRDLGEHAVAAALRHLRLDCPGLLVELVAASAEVGALDVAVGVEVDESLALRLDGT